MNTAIRAHTGRLLAYSLPIGAGNQIQSRLIKEALSVRALPDRLRGAAQTLRGLAGAWAHDPAYADKLASVANDVRTSAAETPGRRPIRQARSQLGRGLAVWQLPARPREVAGVAVWEALEVVLVFGLGLPEGPASLISVTTLPGQRPEASTSATVSSAT